MIFAAMALALATSAAPPVEAEGEKATQAERRLRACLAASSGGQATLEAAVVSARAACKPQIDRVRDARVLAETAGLDPAAAQPAERRVTLALNHEIAMAVANFSGLPVPNASGPDASNR